MSLTPSACIGKKKSISCCFRLLTRKVGLFQRLNCLNQCFDPQNTCTTEKVINQNIFYFVNTFQPITCALKAASSETPELSWVSHQLSKRSAWTQHLPALRASSADPWTYGRNKNANIREGQMANCSDSPAPSTSCMRVSLCCLGRSWNRHHTSWMQMSHLIWHFQ